MADRPPDLDPSGNPVGAKPPDLDVHGNPDAPTTAAGGTLQSLEQAAKDTGAGIWGGVKTALDPRSYIGHAPGATPSYPFNGDASGKLPMPDVAGRLRALVTPEGVGNVIGQLLTGLAGERTVGAVGGLLRTGAPHAMDMGLQRTQADRLDFPNTPQRLVDERIVPRGTNVPDALAKTEAKINADATAFDRPRLTGPGVPIPQPPADPRAMAAQAQQFATKAGHVAGLGNVAGPEAAEIKTLGRDYLDQNTRPRGLQETIDQKRAYQQRSKYPNKPNAPESSNNAMNFNKGMAQANRGEAIRMNPELEGDLSKEQDLIGADTALQKLNAKSTPLSAVAHIKTGLFLRNPTVMGGAALGMDSLGRGLQSVPELIRAALLAQMTAPHTEQP